MPYFMRNGSRFQVSSKKETELYEILPTDTYTVKFNPMSGTYFLEIVEGFSVSGRIYGNTEKQASKILNTFKDRPASTGVLLTGQKGSGKTLLAKLLSVEGQKLDYPTIIINESHFGEGFNAFMQQIEQPVVVLFDEFEKVYDPKEQEQLLTLLDGVYPSKKLYVLTCNDEYRIDSHMRNRPGRIYYRLNYSSLDQEFIREYCTDNLNNQEHVEGVVRMAYIFSDFNFDVLKAIVEEMNRYDESPQEVVAMLNAKPEYSTPQSFEANFQVKGVSVKRDPDHTDWRGIPVRDVVAFQYEAEGDDDNDEYRLVSFGPNHIVQLDANTGTYVYENGNGDTLRLKRKVTASYDWTLAAL
jgi:hypothetical protein